MEFRFWGSGLWVRSSLSGLILESQSHEYLSVFLQRFRKQGSRKDFVRLSGFMAQGPGLVQGRCSNSINAKEF